MSLLRVKTLFDSDEPELKTFVRNFLHSLKVDCEVQRTEEGKTALEIETLQGTMPHVKRLLFLALDKHFNSKIPVPAVLWVPIEPKGTKAAKLTHTDESIARHNSSGQISLNDEIAPDDSISVGAQDLLNLAKEGFSRANSVVSNTSVKVVFVAYQDSTPEAMEVSKYASLGSWRSFLDDIKKILNIPAIIRKIYCNMDGKKVYVSDLIHLKAETFYFVETDLNAPVPAVVPTSSKGMKEFFTKLKTEEDVTDEDIEDIKDVFAEQKIKFKQLVQTGKFQNLTIGDLAITNGELEKYGIKQGGLRKAILSLVKSNQK